MTVHEFKTLPNGTLDIPRELIEGFEARHTSYVRSQVFKSKDDMVVVKELVHLKDGRVLPQLRMKVNPSRDFYITKEGFRKHDQKKEYEELGRLKRFTTTQREMAKSVSRALGWTLADPQMRVLTSSPYLYGSDISITALTKKHYMDSFPKAKSTPTVAILDLETNTYGDKGEIISGSLTMKNRVLLVISKDFISGTVDLVAKINKAFDKYLKKFRDSRNIDIVVEIAEHEGEITKKLLSSAHEWQPDFVACWNISFDMGKMIQSLDRHEMDKADIFSDPRVPRDFRYFKWREKPLIKRTATGKESKRHYADLWHVCETPASFYFIDFMCLYKLLRVTEPMQPSYSLDHILKINGLGGKLKFEEADAFTQLSWHRFMQKNYKIEYLIYNIYDCISLELLEEKNNDLSGFVVNIKHSDYGNFTSQPRRLCDDLHFFYKERKKIAGSTSAEMKEDLDKYVLGMEGWITIAV